MRRARALLVAALLGGACGSPAGPTFLPDGEPFPAAGSFHVVGDPATAERPLSVHYAGGDGNPSAVSDDFAVGELVVIGRTTFAGQYSVLVGPDVCDGTFAVEADRETDLILRVATAGCAAIVTGIHPVAEGFHGEVFVVVNGSAPIGAAVSVTSLDDPPRRAPQATRADESGIFQVDRLPPGRYRVEVTLEGAIVGNATVDLEAGQTEYLEFDPSSSPSPD